MLRIRDWMGRLRRRQRLEREMDEEIRFHLERETEDLIGQGVPPREARRRARVRFGGIERIREEVRSARGLGRSSGLRMDVRVAARGVRRHPGLSVAVVVTLGLGIGASVAVLGIVRSVLDGPLPYRDAEALIFVWGHSDGQGERLRVSGPDAARIASSVGALERVAFIAQVSEASVAVRGEPAMPVLRALVTPDWFRTVGITPAAGSDFVDSGSTAGGVELLVSDGLHRALTAGSEPGVGQELTVNGRTGTVVGVLPPAARLVLPPELGIRGDIGVWEVLRTPLESLQRVDRLGDQDSDASGIVVARKKPGASLETVQASLNAIASGLRRDVPGYDEQGFGLEARALREDIVAGVRPVLRTALAAVLLVLALATANATGLLLTHALARSREMAVRSALGAGRWRLARQVVLDHGALVLPGALLGMTGAALTLRVIGRTALFDSLNVTMRMDRGVIAFALGATAACLLVTTLVMLVEPTLGRIRSVLAMRGAISQAPGTRRLRDALVVLQVAITLALLAAGGVMTRTAMKLTAQDPGFAAAGALAFRIGIAFPERYRGPAERAALIARLESTARAQPGVTAAGIVGGLPLSGTVFTQPVLLPGDPPASWGTRRVNYRVVSAGWFEAMGVRLLAGRGFESGDDRQDVRVALIDERLAADMGRDALGRNIRVPIDGALEDARVVGVVANIRYESLAEPGRATIYIPYRHEASRQLAFVLRVNAVADVEERIRREFARIDPDIALHDVRSLDSLIAEARRPAQTVSLALGVFGLLALLLSLVALHGAVAYGVARRTAEIALRRALGATPARIVREVVRTGLVPALTGLGLGGVLTLAGSLGLRALVYGVSPLDPLALGAAIGVLVVGCTAACLLAARRALRIGAASALAEG